MKKELDERIEAHREVLARRRKDIKKGLKQLARRAGSMAKDGRGAYSQRFHLTREVDQIARDIRDYDETEVTLRMLEQIRSS